jgi:hypothetical protein
MRLSFVTLFSLTVLCACNTTRHPQAHTAAPSNMEASSLLSIANNRSARDSDRILTIFTLFSKHIRIGATATQVRESLNHSPWLDISQVRLIDVLRGWVPIEMNESDSVFSVTPFQLNYTIYIRLSGKLKEPELCSFFSGQVQMSQTHLLEFALCYPDSRIEHYSQSGRRDFRLYQ